jgi:hypothetical protein
MRMRASVARFYDRKFHRVGTWGRHRTWDHYYPEMKDRLAAQDDTIGQQFGSKKLVLFGVFCKSLIDVFLHLLSHFMQMI